MVNLKDRYGPWALIAGASEGVGSSAASLLADAGINLVLVGRKQRTLDELGASLPVETRSLVLDLNTPDAAQKLAEGTADLEVGLLIYNTGAPGCVPPRSFLSEPVAHWQEIVSRNAMTVTTACHHFGGRMVARGRGGIVLVGSTAGWAGTENMAIYCATKAFQRGLAESLWAEWRQHGVDVLAMVLGVTDTPAFRRIMAGVEVAGAADCDVIAQEMMAALPDSGPTWPAGPEPFGEHMRRDAVLGRNEQRSTMFARHES